MNSGGMPSIQINLLLEKDFLHECCQTVRKGEENVNAVFDLIFKCRI